MKDLIIFPFGGNARESLLAIQAQNAIRPSWNVVGFIDDDERLWGRIHCGIRVLGGRDAIHEFPSAQILAVPGNPENFTRRDAIIDLFDISPDRYATIVDPSAKISQDGRIGGNTLLMANVVVSSSVEIGDHCVILPNTVVSHETRIDDYSLIGSNVSISGFCSIGKKCYVGSGSTIKDHLKLGSGCLVGMGSCVIRDVPPDTVVAGNPAQPLKR
jgi:sugar O-acyltransferase (sialic acid O-acetyltransferase NeuD family)